MSQLFFISGIDTNIGKSYATGFLAGEYAKQGKSVITQKLIQTGNQDISEDIELHRKIMGTGLLPEDRKGLTMPEIFTYPASPHLASKIDNRAIDFDKIEKSTENLLLNYDVVLLEGAGGLMVPLTEDLLTIDYVKEKDYPLILVTSGRLGSINHTMLSLEAIERRGIYLHAILYNSFGENSDRIIEEDTFRYIRKQMEKRFPSAEIKTVPVLDVN